MGHDLMAEVPATSRRRERAAVAFLAAVTAERRARQMMKAEAERARCGSRTSGLRLQAQANAHAAWLAGRQQPQ